MTQELKDKFFSKLEKDMRETSIKTKKMIQEITYHDFPFYVTSSQLESVDMKGIDGGTSRIRPTSEVG